MNIAFEKIKEKLEELKKSDDITFAKMTENGHTLDEVTKIIDQVAEEHNNGWIPVEKRLPKVPEGLEDAYCPEFNVTIKGASKATTLKCDFEGVWFDDFGNVYKVLAWQPLPEPYQKGE